VPSPVRCVSYLTGVTKKKGGEKKIMTDLKKKIAVVFASGALLLNTVLPVFAQQTYEISGNGTNSDNEITSTITTTTTVVQENVADVYNDVDVDADTGGNDANDNTGGDVEIDTGDADVDVAVGNTLNSNSAEVGCCPSGPIDVLISGNASDTDNDVNLGLKSGTEVFQSNYADVTNKVDADADTGDNDAEDNTGGSVKITTGDAEVDVEVFTTANANSAQVGDGGGLGSLSARILGNGTKSDNEIKIDLASQVLLAQENVADIFNGVWADADTGDNDAKDNTGGDVEIDTGDADVDVEVDNMVNFNWADLDCGCLLEDLLAKIAGNASDSTNKITLKLGQGQLAFQGNCAEEGGPEGLGDDHKGDCELDNKVDADADTGDNDAEDNTGGVDGADPTIETGDAHAGADIDNSGNVNVLGDGPDLELPGDWGVDFGFNWAFFWAWLMGSSE